MKVGIVEKMVFNMLLIILMVKIGKVYYNLMVDVKLINEKFVICVKYMIELVIGVFVDEVSELFVVVY